MYSKQKFSNLKKLILLAPDMAMKHEAVLKQVQWLIKTIRMKRQCRYNKEYANVLLPKKLILGSAGITMNCGAVLKQVMQYIKTIGIKRQSRCSKQHAKFFQAQELDLSGHGCDHEKRRELLLSKQGPINSFQRFRCETLFTLVSIYLIMN